MEINTIFMIKLPRHKTDCLQLIFQCLVDLSCKENITVHSQKITNIHGVIADIFVNHIQNLSESKSGSQSIITITQNHNHNLIIIIVIIIIIIIIIVNYDHNHNHNHNQNQNQNHNHNHNHNQL
jgi:hypothetical protein